MKYEEFREYLKRNGIHLEEDEERLTVDAHIEISKTEMCKIVFLVGDIKYPYEYEMLKKVNELTETPLDEREEKNYLKHKFINNYSAKNHINLVANEDVILSGRLCEEQRYKMKFTKTEIEQFKKRFDTDLRDFELIEVED